MHAALEIAAYILGITLLVGLVMAVVLVRDLFFHGRFVIARPLPHKVPTLALDEARSVLKRLEALQPRLTREQRPAVAYEIRHLKLRLTKLEDKAYTDQSDYFNVVRAWERCWRDWKALHEQRARQDRHQRGRSAGQLQFLKEEYLRLEREANEELHRALARDRLTLEELRSQAVLNLEILGLEATAPGAPPEREAGTSAAGAEDGPDRREAPAPGEEDEAPTTASEPSPPEGGAPAPQIARWSATRPPYPPANQGELGQADFALPDLPKRERVYRDPAFSLSGQPGGVMVGADLSRGSFAEVEFVGVHRYKDCAFVATDLRRIVLARADKVHQFFRCDLRGALLEQSRLSHVLFRECDLSGTHWRGSRLERVAFEQCRVEDVHWEGVDLSQTRMSPDMLGQADLSQASRLPRNVYDDRKPAGARAAPAREGAAVSGSTGRAQAGPPSADKPPEGSPPPTAPPSPSTAAQAATPAPGLTPPADTTVAQPAPADPPASRRTPAERPAAAPPPSPGGREPPPPPDPDRPEEEK